MAYSAVDALMAETEAHEEAEPPVEANPKIGRAALSYLEPRPGLDGLEYAGQCGACQMFTPEASMGGAVIGDRCAILGSRMPVTDDSSCRFFVPWASGLPCEALTMFNAVEMRKGLLAAISPGDAVYLRDCNTQCCGCKFYKYSDAVPGRGDCKAFEKLNESVPTIFELNTSVHPRGGCAMWQAPDEKLAGSSGFL